ncbi:MAG: GNAT family N-acetyltransferase [Alphaproteobacteria bacterium]
MSTPAISIRPALPADFPAITALIAELNRGEGRLESAGEDAIAELLRSGHGGRLKAQAIVAEEGTRLLGVALFYWGYDTVSATYGYLLADIVVTERSRGQRTGRRLFTALAQQAAREGAKWVSLTVLRKNPRAQKFYASLGMVEMGVDVFAIGPLALRKLV